MPVRATCAIGWFVACVALAAITTPAIGGKATVAASQAWPCPPVAVPMAAPKRAMVKRKFIAKPAAVQTVGVGLQNAVVRKPKRATAKPVAAPSAARAPLQDGCMPAPVAAPRALNTLVGGAAPAAPAYPQSALPPFTVPLDVMPAIVHGAPDTGAPVPLHAMPAISDGAPGTGAPVWAPGMPFAWLPATLFGGSSSSSSASSGAPAPSPVDTWSAPPQWPGVPALADLPVKTDPELQQPDEPGQPELPVLGPNLEPTDPTAPGVTTPGEVPEPASLALMLAGLLAVWAQALRKRRQARTQR